MGILINSDSSAEPAVNQPPTIDSVTITPSTAARNSVITITADGADRFDGTVRNVAFFVDIDGNGIVNTGDRPLGTDGSPLAQFQFTRAFPKTPPLGIFKFSPSPATTKALHRYSDRRDINRHQLHSDTQSPCRRPPSLLPGKHLNLIVTGTKDTDGKIAKAEFWLDQNENGVIDADVDELLSTDTTAANGFKFSPDTTGTDPGVNTVLARVFDNDGAESATAAATVTILPSVVDLSILGTTTTPS